MEEIELLKAMLAEMKANMKSNQAKADTSMKTNQEMLTRLEAKIETNRETDLEERKAERKAYQKGLKKIMEEILRAIQDKMDAWLTEKQDGRKEMTACQEATEANPEKLKTCQRRLPATKQQRQIQRRLNQIQECCSL
jgi:hypothetical protein